MKSTTKVSDFVRRVFPERQIYHRSGGTVRYFTISPLQQIILAGAAAALVGWSLFASATVVFGQKSVTVGSAASEVNRLERWVQDLRA